MQRAQGVKPYEYLSDALRNGSVRAYYSPVHIVVVVDIIRVAIKNCYASPSTLN